MRMDSLTPARCAQMLRSASAAVALTGAGISTAAGIPDFRGPEGIYATRRYDPERVFDIEHFRRDPREFYRFTHDLMRLVDELRPSYTHRALATLEAEGMLRAVITQNIDPLHRLAGSRTVVAVHGDYAASRCLDCEETYDYDGWLARLRVAEVPRCDCGGVLKPAVVFFGEAVRQMPRAEEYARACDLMLVLGSSLAVYPVALLPQIVSATVVVVNRGEVALPPAPGRYFVEADLDDYFRAVMNELDLETT